MFREGHWCQFARVIVNISQASVRITEVNACPKVQSTECLRESCHYVDSKNAFSLDVLVPPVITLRVDMAARMQNLFFPKRVRHLPFVLLWLLFKMEDEHLGVEKSNLKFTVCFGLLILYILTLV